MRIIHPTPTRAIALAARINRNYMELEEDNFHKVLYCLLVSLCPYPCYAVDPVAILSMANQERWRR